MNRVLLHACCAPCAGAVLERMVADGLRPVVFFSNSNIDSAEEYALRRDTLARYAASLGVEMVDDAYDHAAWLQAVAGLEHEPERGARCAQCFRFRLGRAARYAAENGFDTLATTLASSRWKSLEQVNAAGAAACETVSGVDWWDRNWRKGGLQQRRSEIIREQGFYNQNWCGCEFSRAASAAKEEGGYRA